MGQPGPFLEKPTSGWKEDLPETTISPEEDLVAIGLPPNHVDNNYLELHTSRIAPRGLIVWLAIAMFGISLSLIYFIFFEFGTTGFMGYPLTGFMHVALVMLTLIFGIGSFRMDTAAPRDEPIRFNRQRRKVYFYRFHEGWALSRKAWQVRPVVFNWDDLCAEAWSRMGPGTVSIFAWGVDIAVVEPGTNHVIDRFQLAGSNANGEHMWAMARAFMNQGPEALPTYPHPPRDWNDDVPWYNLALRLAPKVQWPADMDRESRTAP